MRIEPAIVEALHSMISMKRNRPRAQVALKKANREFKAVLRRWETAYNEGEFLSRNMDPPAVSAQRFVKAVTPQPLISSAC